MQDFFKQTYFFTQIKYIFSLKLNWFFCYSISYRIVKSDSKKSPPFKSYSKNSESPSKKFLINTSIFVLQRYLCYEYWAMCYEVFLMCYVSRPYLILYTFNTSLDFCDPFLYKNQFLRN